MPCMNYELREQMAMVIRGLLENRHGMRATDRRAPFTKRTAHPWRMEMMNAVEGRGIGWGRRTNTLSMMTLPNRGLLPIFPLPSFIPTTNELDLDSSRTSSAVLSSLPLLHSIYE